MGVEGRHRHNMVAVFQYMAALEKAVNDHADAIDGASTSAVSLRRRFDGQGLEVESVKLEIEGMKVELGKAGDDNTYMAEAISSNDRKLKADFAESVKGTWGPSSPTTSASWASSRRLTPR